MIKKAVFAGLGLALLASPLLVSADQLSDLQAQVANLLAQLKAIQASLPTSPPIPVPPPPVGPTDDYGTGTNPTGVYCPKLSITMQRGARDAAYSGQVSELQAFLTDYYNLNENIVVGGYFGKLTEQYLVQFQNEQGLPAFGIAGSLTRAKIASVCGGNVTPPQNGITVTAPNGGEQWEEGVLNTVTWTPYNYNPDINPAKDVTAYLEKMGDNGNFVNYGKVEESGKASIHWITGEVNSASQPTLVPSGGGYYIRVVNNKTGAWDRSDAPFTLLPKSVDLKVNGSDGPVTLSDNQPITVSISAGNVNSCRLFGVRQSVGGDNLNGLQIPVATGPNSYSLFAYAPAGGGSTSMSVNCLRSDGTSVSDWVAVNIAGGSSASLQVTSPNGGEQVRYDQNSTIMWNQTGMGSLAIALYMNDKWSAWINKALNPDEMNSGHYTWLPSQFLPPIAELSQKIFKIYITGQKADGSGYVDDKSDAPFSFMNGATSTGTFVMSVAPFPTSQTVLAGTAGATVANIVLDTTNATQDIRLGQIMLTYTDNISPDLSTCQAFVGASALNTGSNTVNLNTSGVGPQAVSFVFDNPLVVTHGSALMIPIKCNIPSSAAGSFSLGLMNGTAACGTGVGNGQVVCPVVVTNAGPTMTIAAGGALSVSTDPSSPAYQVVAGGATGVTLSVSKIHATGESVNISKLDLLVANSNLTNHDVAQVYAYSSSGQLLGSIVLVGDGAYPTMILSNPLLAQRDTDTRIILKADIAAIGTGQPAHPGDLVQIGVLRAIGAGSNSGLTITGVDQNPIPNIPGARIFKSFPTVALVPLSNDGLSDGRLIRFSVTASPTGSVGINMMYFTVQGSNTTVDNVTLYGYTDSSYSSPIAGQGIGGQIRVLQRTALPLSPVQIPAGQTYYFELRGSASSVSANATVQTQLLGDGVSQGVSPASSVIGTFVWSGNSTTTSQPSDADWANGYGIPGLSSPSEILQNRAGSAPVPTPAPYGNFDSFLTSGPLTSSTPTISGTAANTNSVNVIIGTPGSSYFNASAIPVVNGHWSVTVTNALADGSYALSLWNYATNANINNTTITIKAPAATGACSPEIDCPKGQSCMMPAGRGMGTCTTDSPDTRASTQDRNANLASALVALESVLKSLIALLQH